MVKVQVWSDFVCPFCMIAEQPLQEAIEASGVDVAIEWMPFELRPHPAPTLRPEDSYLQTVWPQSVYPVARRFGVTLKLPSVSPQPYSALAWQGYQYARDKGLGADYHHRVLCAFFQDDLDIGRIEVLVTLAQQLGLDAEDFEAALREGRYLAAHTQALIQARELGVSSVPSLRIGRHWLPGVQSAEVLLQVLREASR